MDVSKKCRYRKKNRQLLKNKICTAIGPVYVNNRFNWARYDGLCYYSVLLIEHYHNPLGKRQIEKYLTQVCPKFESFLEKDGFARSNLLSQIKIHMKRKRFRIPYNILNHPNIDGSNSHYYYYTRAERAPTPAEKGEDASVSSDLPEDMDVFIQRYRLTFKYLNVDKPPAHLQYVPPEPCKDSTDLHGTVISYHAEDNTSVRSFRSNEGFDNLPTCSSTSKNTTRRSTFNHEYREEKRIKEEAKKLKLSMIKPSTPWKTQQVSDETLEQAYQPPLSNYFTNSNSEYREYEKYIFDGLMTEDKFDELTGATFRYAKDTYLKAYRKTLDQYLKELQDFHDPIESLRDKELKQDAIDLAYTLAKTKVEKELSNAISFITNLWHLKVFDFGFLRALQHKAQKSYVDEKCCWCPCNKYLDIWRKQFGCIDSIFLKNANICNNKQMNPQGMIDHAKSFTMKQCKVHRLIYLYLYYLYDGEVDINKVSTLQSNILSKKGNLNIVKRYMY